MTDKLMYLSMAVFFAIIAIAVLILGGIRSVDYLLGADYDGSGIYMETISRGGEIESDR